MADKKITDLTGLTTADSGDTLAIVDVSAGTTKKVTVAGIADASWASVADGSVATADIADAAITNAKLSTTAGEVGGAWTTWSPTWANLTVGSGSVSARYTKVGKTVTFELMFTYGSGSSVGSAPSFTLPVTAASYYDSNTVVGVGALRDSSPSTLVTAVVRIDSTTVASVFANNASSTYGTVSVLSSTVPFTWATGDVYYASGRYEAA